MCAVPVAIKQDANESKHNDTVKALVIDDSKLDQMILKRMLVNNGHDVCLASSGDMAIEMFEDFDPDIVLMDINLPDISGYDLTKIIKRLSADKYIPVIFVTGTSDDDSLGECLDSGGDDFIIKPVKENLLNAKTGSLLRVKKMHDELFHEKEEILSHRDEQLKDLYDADKVIHNIHKPRFYNSGNLEWSYVAQNILSGDIICSAIDPSGNHIILVGDNTGHGLPAAIGSMITCETFYSMVNKGFDIQLIIEEINKKLFYLLPTDRFLSACIMEIDFEYRLIKIWNAGIPAVILCGSNGELKNKLPSVHLPLGITLIHETEVVPIRVNLEDGDRIYAYTDGLTEIFDETGEMYGEKRLLTSISNYADVDKRIDAIINDANQYSNHAPATDDILLLEINCDKSCIKGQNKHKISCVESVPMEWHIRFEFKNDILCKSNPIPAVIQSMVDIQGFGGHREKIFLVLTEMYSNAVEHGLLKLDSIIKNEENGFLKYYELRQARLSELNDGLVLIDVDHYVEGDKGIVSLTMENNGVGFDFKQYISTLNSNVNKSGRGIALIQDLCRKCIYTKDGCKLNVEYEWDLINTINAA
jgi:two-component system, HptB-dependent secretion and biofilm response regulator